jgi:2-amino-4-hydroxy-6-hydroxymethyldihydropteridine diphosphokinase
VLIKYLICKDINYDMKSDTHRAYLLLGSNLGEREEVMVKALDLIAAHVGVIVLKSGIYETAAWGKTDQPAFLNLAIAVDTKLDPGALLAKILWIEKLLGRVRRERWGARLIDIDIILYGNEVIDLGPTLQIPHPEMQHRKFVLQPLSEIAANIVHPILKRNMNSLLAALTDTLSVEKR